MPIDAPNYQWASGVPYIVADRGTMALGVKDVSPFVPDTLTGSENFETDPITGSGTWTLTTSSPRSGLRCLRSAVIGNSSSTDYTFTVPGGTNFLRFWHRVSSESGFDFFQVYKNVAGVPANLLFQLSGTANLWAQSQFSMAGVTSVIFRYIKDSSSAVGLDAAFIDDIEWIGTLGSAAVQNYEPYHLDANNCVKVSLCSNVVTAVDFDIRNLNCAQDSVEICNDAGNPIHVLIDNVDLDIRNLDCSTDSVTICPGDDPIEVTVNNFPVVANLDCLTDSVTICPGDDPIEVTVNNFPVVANLDCLTDSVTICPGDDPIEVTVNNFPVVANLDCATDSVTICPGDDPIEVTVNNFPVVANLDCATDSVTICPGEDPIVVIATDLDIRPLNCATDSIEICNDAGSPITVNVTNIPHVIVDSLPEVEIKNDAGNPIPVSFTRLNCATDSVEICNDTGNPIPVSATDLDIRNLTCATDKVGACQEGDWTVGVEGEVDVNVIGGTITVVPGPRSLRGVYYGTSGALAYTSAADAATGGDLWIVNTSDTVVAYLREVRFTANIAALALLTALPRINMERMTFTGTPSGTLITPARRDSLDFANTATARTTSTGMVITAGAAIKSFTPPSSDVVGGLLAANASSAVPVEQIFVGDLDSFIVLRQNEGIVFRQASAGSLTENRIYQVDFIWEEI